MLFVRTKLATSQIHGIGLFADQFIPKGAVVCSYHQSFDHGFSSWQLHEFPEVVRKFIKTYSYLHNGVYYVNMDNARFFNHSFEPNVISVFDSFDDVAARDIQENEELTVNYFSFDEEAIDKVGANILS